jgi:hypothetical protein
MSSRPASRLEALLAELCAEHGWCGAGREAEHIRGLGSDAARIVDAVLRAEGVAPETARREDRALLTQRVEDWLIDPAGRGARSGLP